MGGRRIVSETSLLVFVSKIRSFIEGVILSRSAFAAILKLKGERKKKYEKQNGGLSALLLDLFKASLSMNSSFEFCYSSMTAAAAVPS